MSTRTPPQPVFIPMDTNDVPPLSPSLASSPPSPYPSSPTSPFSASSSRARSDTVSSSWSDEPTLATPQTPSIIGVLSPSKRRAPSYGFPSTLPEDEQEDEEETDSLRRVRRDSTMFDLTLGDPVILESQTLAPPAQISSTPYPSSTGSVASGPSGSGSGSSGSSTPRSLSQAVRHQIVRSKASFRRLRDNDQHDQWNGAAGSGSPPWSRNGHGRSRLKSFISLQRRNRAQSLSSPHMSTTTAEVTFNTRRLPNELHEALASVQTPFATLATQRHVQRDITEVNGEGSTMQRAAFSRRPHLRSMSLPQPPFNVVLTSAGLQPVGSDQVVWGTLSYRTPAARQIDYFGSRLPRELKIKVFRALVNTFAAKDGPGRWDGVNGGRKELIRLSRVSKEWRSLCFDGQLWAQVDLTPFASVLSETTMQQILVHARPCVKDLSLRGLDAITGKSLMVGGALEWSNIDMSQFSSLTSLDLYGCHSLTPKDVISLLEHAPNLKKLCLKGSRMSLGNVLRAIRHNVIALEELDVSRCWSLEFLDIETFILRLNPRQRNALGALRIAGLTSTTGGHLLKTIAAMLPNLHTLDLLGCKWLGALDIKDYVCGLGTKPSPLRHLVISSCTNLTTDSLDLLIHRLPLMTHFEAAGLEPVFYLDPPPTLIRLVHNMPLLERLDLDGTGRYGGVCDRLLDELIPGAVPNSPLTESHLVELRIGAAKNVTAVALRHLVSALPKLVRLELDGTEANDPVLRAFLSRGRAVESISLIDCHHLSQESYDRRTRARAGWDDYRSTVFAYTPDELRSLPVLKTFWAWRCVRPPKLWRDARDAGEKSQEVADRQVVRGNSWWRSDEFDDMERGACIVM